MREVKTWDDTPNEVQVDWVDGTVYEWNDWGYIPVNTIQNTKGGYRKGGNFKVGQKGQGGKGKG